MGSHAQPDHLPEFHPLLYEWVEFLETIGLILDPLTLGRIS